MNAPLQSVQPPNAPAPIQGAKDFKTVVKQLSGLSRWAQDFSLWLTRDTLAPIQRKVNGTTDGISTVASGTNVTLSTAVTHITGTGTITNLTPGPGFSGVAWLIADDAFSLGVGGNIALARGPFTPGQAIKVVFDPSVGANGTWYVE